MSDNRGTTGELPQKLETTITRIEMAETPIVDDGESCLIVFYGDGLGRRYFLNRNEMILGRSDSAHIQVDQDAVSRHHAKIVVQPGLGPKIVDLGSTNGTYVNNQRVGERLLLDGDLVRIGQTIFKHLSGNNVENKYHEEIYRLTTIDGLTEAYNKRFFLETLERETTRASRYQRDLCLVMFDIDHFKRINDTYGHLAGDQVLRDLARVVTGSLRRQDVFARYGGEEFSVVLPELELEAARVVCEKLRGAVDAYAFSFHHTPIRVTISLGLAAYAQPNETSEAFIARADGHLYAAKQGGRNRVHC